MADEAPVARTFSNDDLKRRSSQLKRVDTKTSSVEPTAEEVEAISKIFKEKSGDSAALATQFGVDVDLLKDHAPSDAAEFTKGLFSGLYTKDKTEAAKDNLRSILAQALRTTRGSLRKSITRTSTGPSAEDIAAASKIYEDAKGDTDAISKLGLFAERLLRSDPPETAADFAMKVLAGNYTEEQDEAAKLKLRETLRGDLARGSRGLRKSITKEHQGPSKEDLEMTAKWFPTTLEELEGLAEKVGLSAALLKANPPVDPEDFARKVLEGSYTEEKSESAKAQLRERLIQGIKERRGSLKKVFARRMSNVSHEELDNFAWFFTQRQGNLDTIASDAGIPVKVLKENPPADAISFALKLMNGEYTVDMHASAKSSLRQGIRLETKQRRASLKKTSTKEWDGLAAAEDVRMFAKLYEDRRGNLAEIAKALSLSEDALNRNPPADAVDFAKNALLGTYTPEAVAAQLDSFRQTLAGKVKERRPSLKQTETRIGSGAPEAADIVKVAKLYNDANGDLLILSRTYNLDLEKMTAAKPKDANDFAVKILTGAYK